MQQEAKSLSHVPAGLYKQLSILRDLLSDVREEPTTVGALKDAIAGESNINPHPSKHMDASAAWVHSLDSPASPASCAVLVLVSSVCHE